MAVRAQRSRQSRRFDDRIRRAAPMVLACVLLAGCGGPEDEKIPPSIDLPACTGIASFGNGATCTPEDAGLKACGGSGKRTCASSWLCFDAPEYVDCACTADADCDTRTAYINAARVAAKKAPLAAKCLEGRCAGRP